jgi:hypothetical protein
MNRLVSMLDVKQQNVAHVFVVNTVQQMDHRNVYHVNRGKGLLI